MNIAASFSAYMEDGKTSAEEALERIKAQGFGSISLGMAGTELYSLKSVIKGIGMESIIHANFVDTNIASANEGIRKESVRQMKDAISFADEIGCRFITFHPGKCRNFKDEENAYSRLFISLDELVPFAAEKSVTLCLENMGKEEKNSLCTTPASISYALQRYKLMGMTFDCAHAVAWNENPVEIYREFRNRIKTIHISGMHPSRSHVEISLKESDYDFTDFIQELRDFDGFVEIENREYRKFEESFTFIKNVTGGR